MPSKSFEQTDRDKWIESVSYQEGVDTLLDGIIPTKDKEGKPIWLKERVQLLIDQNEATADKLSDCWLFIDSLAQSVPGAAELLRKQECPGWRVTPPPPKREIPWT